MEKKKNIFTSENVVKNSIWSVMERVCAQAVSFFISVILARLLVPSDYGVVALIQVFISICSLLVDRGLASALSQKKYPDKEDYYSVLSFGFLTSIFLYVLLCGFSQYIGQAFSKYNPELLSNVIKIMGIALPISSIRVIMVTYVGKNMLFKKFFWATFVGTVISGIIGIIIAYNGGGVYALVAQHLANLTIDSILLAFTIKKPWMFYISFSRLKKLISYGWKVMASSGLTTLVNSLRSTTIASNYDAADLAHYDKGESLPKIVIGNIDVAIANVLFPTMSNSQDDLVKLKEIVRRFVKLSGYVIFPLLLGLFAVSDTLIPTLFGVQWTPAIPYLKIFSLIYLFYPLQDAALLSIRAIGKSGRALIIDMIGKCVILAFLFILLKFGPIYLTVGFLASTVTVVFINAFAMKKYIGYRFHEQLFDFSINLIPAGIMLAAVYFMHYLPINSVALLILQIVTGAIIYIFISAIIKNKQFLYIKQMVTKMIKSAKKTISQSKSFEFSAISIARPVLMGIAMIWIVLFHSGIPAPENPLLRVLYYVFIDFGGGIGVPIFLIVSGFGLMYSNAKRPVYSGFKNWISFMKKRLIKVLIPYTIIFIVYYLIFYLQSGSMGDFFAKYTIWEFFKTGFREYWYIHAILILYIVFPLIAFAFDKFKSHITFIILLLSTIGLDVLLSFILPSYSNIEIFLTRIPCFIIGCYLGKLSLERKRYNLLTLSLTVLVLIASTLLVFLGIHYSFGTHILRYLFSTLSISLVMTLPILLTKIKYKFKILTFIGNNTLYIYLVHILLFCIFSSYTEINVFLRLVMVLIISLIVVVLIVLFKKISKIKRLKT